ncbi:MAG: hypothetical protein LBC97_16605 [Bifidobacteriaceae bacterium]|jgi:hypothetical protein|nr:hypothetical protein [Bifidobacteriaceae bacterium]
MTSALAQAVAVFKELGWADARPDQALSLPTGTKEQRQAALAGLRSGEWGDIAEVSPRAWGYVSKVDVSEAMLALFAVRVGVDARRAANQVRPLHEGFTEDLVADVLASRGAVFAARFIEHACVASRRMWEHSTSALGGVAVRLVERLALPVPDNTEYIKDWAAFAAATLGLPAEITGPQRALPAESAIRDRFAEHVRAGVAAGAPATGPFGPVVAAGVEKGWMGRAEAVELAFAALDAASRPGDRKAWLAALDQLGVENADFAARADGLVPLLATGEGGIVQRLGPVLIGGEDDAVAVEALIAALAAPAKKTLRTVLEAALARRRPEGAEALTGQLAQLAGDRDKWVARSAGRLIDQWGLETGPADTAEPTVLGLWRETPPVWEAPRFDRGEETPRALTELAAELTRRPANCADVLVERFLAVANAVVGQDPAAAKAALRGVREGPSFVYGLSQVPYWVAGRPCHWGLDYVDDRGDLRVFDPLTAREHAVFLRLGQLPCVLSEPSRDDLSVGAEDLADRLQAYAEAGTAAAEADLLLALTRLNPAAVTPAAAGRLAASTVPVVLQSGELMAVTAGEAARAYLADPVREPELVLNPKWRFWEIGRVPYPVSLKAFPNRFESLARGYRISEAWAVFPHWGDAALLDVGWNGEVQRDQGLNLRQVARRAAPLPPGAAVNFLAAQRSVHPVAAEDSALAVSEAWERGLLRPGVADVRYLDWSAHPGNYAALVAALAEIAETGPLAAVWSVLDQLVRASLRAPRLVAGTAEVVDAVAKFLPEALAAVEAGSAAPGVLNLHGVRALAARSGSSRAVAAAREVVSGLPAPIGPPVVQVPVLDPPFDEVWPEGAGGLPAITDGVEVAARWADPGTTPKFLVFDLTVPGGAPGGEPRRFRVAKKDWCYDLEKEGQCEAKQIGGDGEVAAEAPSVWLHWDAALKRLVAEGTRKWAGGGNSWPGGAGRPDLPVSLVTVAIGMVGNGGYSGPNLVGSLVDDGLIGSAAVAEAIRALLRSPDVNPARLVAVVEKKISSLPILWPLLTEPVAHAAAMTGKPPAWLSRVLGAALHLAPYLAEAARRGHLPPEASRWPGVAQLARRSGSSASIGKAKQLFVALSLGG